MQRPEAEVLNWASRYARVYPNKSLLLDTNLLLIYILEEVSPHLAEKHPQVSNYTSLDRLFLKGFVTAFEHRLVTLPHILAETSNLLEPDRKLSGEYRHTFEQVSLILAEQLEEHFIPFKQIILNPFYLQLGTSNAAIICLSEQLRDSMVVLSADRLLAKILAAYGIESIYYPDIRCWN